MPGALPYQASDNPRCSSHIEHRQRVSSLQCLLQICLGHALIVGINARGRPVCSNCSSASSCSTATSRTAAPSSGKPIASAATACEPHQYPVLIYGTHGHFLCTRAVVHTRNMRINNTKQLINPSFSKDNQRLLSAPNTCWRRCVQYRSELFVWSHQHRVLVTGPQQQRGMPRSGHTRKMAAKEAAAEVPADSKVKGEGLLRENSAMDTRSSSPVTRAIPLTEGLAPCCFGALNTTCRASLTCSTPCPCDKDTWMPDKLANAAVGLGVYPASILASQWRQHVTNPPAHRLVLHP